MPRATNHFLNQRTSALLSIAVSVSLMFCGMTQRAGAQGNIFGTVQNSDASAPANGQFRWWGFLDDTDEEIRIETNTGAGYDGLNWFDDFQNYTTENAGNPCDYYFTNLANDERYHLARLIPDNSYQEENVTLATAVGPSQPLGFNAVGVAPSLIRLRWQVVPGVTYHIYRRHTSNNGLFRRLDDPAGALTSPGVGDSTYLDTTSDGISNYTYLLIGEDAGGNYSPHSDEVSVDAGNWCDCALWGDINGDNLVNPFDAVSIINFVYKNWDNRLPSPNCPEESGDVNCDGMVNPVDVVYYVSYVYKNQGGFCDPCGE